MAKTPAARKPAPGKANTNTITVQVQPPVMVTDETAITSFTAHGIEQRKACGK